MQFHPKLLIITQPLTSKTIVSKKKLLEWTLEMEEAFKQIKYPMKEDLLLSFPDHSPEAAKLELYVDALGTGASACLLQNHDRVVCHCI